MLDAMGADTRDEGVSFFVTTWSVPCAFVSDAVSPGTDALSEAEPIRLIVACACALTCCAAASAAGVMVPLLLVDATVFCTAASLMLETVVRRFAALAGEIPTLGFDAAAEAICNNKLDESAVDVGVLMLGLLLITLSI